MKLAAIGSIKDTIIGEETISDFILNSIFFNSAKGKEGILNFVGLSLQEEEKILSETEIKAPNNNQKEIEKTFLPDVKKYLTLISTKYSFKSNNGSPDFYQSSKFFIEKYREGALGNFTLDTVPINIKEE